MRLFTRTLSLLLAQPSRAFCATPKTTATVSLKFDRSIRHLLQPYRKSLTLTIEREAPPLRALSEALRTHGVAETDAQHLLLHHGKRAIDSDAELDDLLGRTLAQGVEPTLRVTPRDLDALPSPPSTVSAPPEPPADASLRLVSFFRFVPLDATTREGLQAELYNVLERLHARGSVYIAAEGINGQLSVPTDALPELHAAFAAMPPLSQIQLNEQHEALGTIAANSPTRPYRKLIVREKAQILTDGLEPTATPLDWGRSGVELEPAGWHQKLVDRDVADGADSKAPLLLDCRNTYESNAGSFDGAVPLGTSVFSESWHVLRERLRDVPRDQPIMTFCTGGIRCVKTNAFLEQELGFTETYRLRDGIHGYNRYVRDALATGGDVEEVTKWRGDNFVFYERSEGDGDGQRSDDGVSDD